MIQIKACTLSDLDTLHDLSIETYRDTFDPYNSEENMVAYLHDAYNKPKLTRELNDPHATFYFAYSDGALAGYLKVNTEDAQSEEMGPDSFEVERIYVRPSFKRHGIGLALINHAFDLAKKAQKKTIWLGVWEHNYPAQAFYKKLGFTQFSSHLFVMGDDPQTDLLMKRPI